MTMCKVKGLASSNKRRFPAQLDLLPRWMDERKQTENIKSPATHVDYFCFRKIGE